MTPLSAPDRGAWCRSGRSRWASYIGAADRWLRHIVQMSPLKLRTGVQERHAGEWFEPGQRFQSASRRSGDRVVHRQGRLREPGRWPGS